MQKNSLLTLMKEEVLRAVVFASALFMILITGFGAVAYAANGGLFGDILAKILGVPDVTTYVGDGSVANAQKLWGKDASNYQIVAPGQSCGAGKCVFGFDGGGNVMCR